MSDEMELSGKPKDLVRALPPNVVNKGLDALLEIVSGAGLVALEYAPAPKIVQDGIRGVCLAVQAAVKGRFLEEIEKGISSLREKGMLLDPKSSEVARDATTELLEFIDSTKVSDRERLNAVKKLYLFGSLNTVQEEDRYLAYTFLKIAKRLDGDDILILKACNKIRQDRKDQHSYPADVDGWARMVATHIGHNISNLVLSREENLLENKLIGRRNNTDDSGIVYAGKARLSDLGIRFCEFLEMAEGALEGL